MAEGLHEHPPVAVVTLLLDGKSDPVPGVFPILQRCLPSEFFGQPYAAVQGRPAHGLRMNEMARRPPHFPNALVGVRPASRRTVDEVDQEFPVVVIGGLPLGVPDPGQTQQLSVDIQLSLAFCGVSDPHGP